MNRKATSTNKIHTRPIRHPFKAIVDFPKALSKRLGKALFTANSARYWNYRLLLNWTSAGGSEQTEGFAISLFDNVNLKEMAFSSVLDYGCALGDSAPIFRKFNKSLDIYLWDISEIGLNKAIKKYSSIDVKRWNCKTKVDFVYCSNVIEHVDDVEGLVEELIRASRRWVCIQAPYNETWPDGSKISPSRPKGEHVRTINDEFIEKYLALDVFEETELVIGKAPQAWPDGEQLYFLGKLRQI